MKAIPPIEDSARIALERHIDRSQPKELRGGVKFQTLCSPNIFDTGKPKRLSWSKEQTDRHRRIKNIRRWIEHFARIRNKQGEIVGITLNLAQRRFVARVMRAWRRGHPAWIVILKPRQTGFSTVVELVIFYLTVTSTYKRGAVIAHKNSISTKILNIFRTALKFAPYELATRHRTRYEVVFDDPIAGSVDVDSAESDDPGHGDTVQYLHLSEVSLWRDAERKARGVMNTVPSFGDMLIVWESTANGADGYFYNLYWGAKAEEDESNIADALFVAWYEHEEYRMPLLSASEREHIAGSLTEEEDKLLKCRYFRRKAGWLNVTYEQLAWRRQTIASKCGGSLEQFHEQYPSTDMEAFLSSGSPVFNIEKLIEREHQCRQPLWEGDIVDTEFEPREAPDEPGGLSAVSEYEEFGGVRKHVEQPTWEEPPKWEVPVGADGPAPEAEPEEAKPRSLDVDSSWGD
jgi:hypothetical protein